MILNGLPWKWIEIILSFFEIASKYCISGSFVDFDGYSISSKGFLPTVVDIMVISPRWWSIRTCAHLLLWELQNYNLLLNNHQQENVGSCQKRIPHVQWKRRSPSKMVGRAKSDLKLTPICISDSQRAQKKPYVLQETSQRLSYACLWVFQCLLHRDGSAVACSRSRGSGYSRLGYSISPLGGDHH